MCGSSTPRRRSPTATREQGRSRPGACWSSRSSWWRSIRPTRAVASSVATASTLADRAIDLLATLVAFDTTSHRSNLDLIAWVETYLASHGIDAERVPDASGAKSNLLA